MTRSHDADNAPGPRASNRPGTSVTDVKVRAGGERSGDQAKTHPDERSVERESSAAGDDLDASSLAQHGDAHG
jgi:hypothetical protein